MVMYEYCECEEDVSQYDEYDFSDGKLVDARYVKALVDSDSGNPYIEALPYPRSDQAVKVAYTKTLGGYSYDKVKSMTTLQKMLQVGTLRQLRFPLTFHKTLEFDFYNALLTSYRERKQVLSRSKDVEYVESNSHQSTRLILCGDSGAATNAGFSLIGYSGCGKSSAINALISHYPQVIMHNDGNNGYFPQIVYLVVNCIANSNFSALYEGIGDAIDKAFGNVEPVYAKEIAKAHGLGKKAEKVKGYIEKFGVGIIIFDEIQLIDFEHTKENSFDSLLTLANRTKVAIAVVGTEDARDKMFRELRTSRRIGTMINGNLYCENKEFFSFLVNQLFRYQWFDTPLELTQDIIDALYDVTKGIIDQLIGVYSCMNYDYLSKKKKPVINGIYVKQIAEKYYPGMQYVLANLKNIENEQALAELRNNAEVRVNELLDLAKQEQEAKTIVLDKELYASNTVELTNVIANIQNLYDEYTERQIEEAFIKVVSRKSNIGKSEKEISRAVIEHLQKKPKRNNPKNKIEAPDMEHMKSFLGLD